MFNNSTLRVICYPRTVTPLATLKDIFRTHDLWWVRAALLLGLFTPILPAYGVELKTLEFSPDHRTEDLDIAGTDCTAMLDDESNFSIEQKSDHVFLVSTDGNSSRAALLLISCKGFDQQFALQYSLSSTDLRSFGSGGVSRPAASVGTSAESGRDGIANMSMDYADYSYLPFGYTFRKSYLRQNSAWEKTDSVDMTHDFESVNVHYGLSVGDVSGGQQRTVRADVGLFGNILGTSQTTYSDSGEDRQVRAYISAPIGLRLSHSVDRDHTEVRRAERSFFYASRSSETILTASVAQTILETQAATTSSASGISEKWNRFGTIRPIFDTAATCEHGDRCYSQSVGISSEIMTKAHFARIRYAPYPHQLALDHRFNWGAAHEWDSAVVMQFEPLPWIMRQSWVTPQSGMRAASANSFVHLEDRAGPWVKFVEHTLPFYNSEAEAPLAQVQQIISRWGIRYEGARLSSGAALTIGYGHTESTTLLLDIRYYLDQNVARLVERSQKKSISGKVASESTALPIEGAVIQLFRNDEELGRTTSNAEGDFVFESIGCCGEIELEAESKGKKAKERMLLSTGKNPEAALLLIPDRLKVPVQFLVDSNASGTVDPEDEKVTLDNAILETDDCIVTIEGGRCRGNDIWLNPESPIVVRVNEELLPFRYRLKRVVVKPDYKLGSGDPIMVLLEVREESAP